MAGVSISRLVELGQITETQTVRIEPAPYMQLGLDTPGGLPKFWLRFFAKHPLGSNVSILDLIRYEGLDEPEWDIREGALMHFEHALHPVGGDFILCAYLKCPIITERYAK